MRYRHSVDCDAGRSGTARLLQMEWYRFRSVYEQMREGGHTAQVMANGKIGRPAWRVATAMLELPHSRMRNRGSDWVRAGRQIAVDEGGEGTPPRTQYI